MNIEDLSVLVNELRENTISPSSKKVYICSSKTFAHWISENHPDLLSTAFFDVLMHNDYDISGAISDCLKSAETCPINLLDLTTEIFMQWIVSLRKGDGKKPGKSAYGGHRSALVYLYSYYNVDMPKELEKGLAKHYKGLKRQTAERAAEDPDARIKIGKDPLQFGLYRFMCKEFLASGDSHSIFAHAFLTITWNLMCRSKNTLNVCLGHLGWAEDALLIYFAHMKNDQMGERPRDPRHIYANPLIPEVCPILALGIYWLRFDFERNPNALFPGDKQYDRFRQILNRFTTWPNVSEELKRRGIKSDDLGTHSIRKGAATYCSSGSTMCPSSAAIHLRAGWTMGGVQDTYIRYEAAGDMYVGRTVSGLPVDKVDFSIVAPHFTDKAKALDAIRLYFPGMPEKLYCIAEFALASLVYHSDFLMETMPASCSIFHSGLFSNNDALTELKTVVQCGIDVTTNIKTTGITAHTSLLREMHLVRQEMRLVAPAVNNALVIELENRAIGSGTLTRDQLRADLEAILQANAPPVAGPPQAPALNVLPFINQEEIVPRATFFWGDMIHLLPEDFTFPTGTPLVCWQYWTCGFPSRAYPPLRCVGPSDMSSRNKRKRLSDFSFLMKKIENEAIAREIWKVDLTLAEANDIYERCKHVIETPATSVQNRRRRRGQLSWSTVVKLLRIGVNQPDLANEDAEEDANDSDDNLNEN